MQAVRSRLFDISLGLWTALFLPALVVLWACGSPEKPIRTTSRLWARGILACLRWIVGLTYVEQDVDNIPREPCLIIANHQSAWETVAFLALVPDVAIVAKQDLLAIPVVGWFLKNSPMILIDRDSGTKAIRKMIDESRAALASGRSVLIFPEGTRKSTSEPIAFKRGVEMLYTRLGRAVLPVAVNSGHFWGPDHPHKRQGTIRVSYLKPIEPGLPGLEFIRRAEQLLETATRNVQPAAG